MVAALAEAGHRVSNEAGRAVIKEQVAIGGTAVPWLDPLAYAGLMLARDVQSYDAASHSPGPVFFDRGLVDIVGYLRLIGESIPRALSSAMRTRRYNRGVFIAPPWAEIFEQDAERRQSFDEAVRTHAAMVEAYSEEGYELISIPCADVAERMAFVLDRLI